MALDNLLLEGLTHAFELQEDCDVKFHVEGSVIGTHKLILNIQCRFLYDLSSSWTFDKDPICIEDIGYNSFWVILRYMYSGVTISNDNVFLFLSASRQFNMKHLGQLCEDHIIKSIGTESACTFMEEALNFKSLAIQEKCLEIFSKKTAQVMRMDSFWNISQHAVSAFLDVEEANVVEIDIFLQMRKWMVKKCLERGLPVNGGNMRRVIGEALYKVRFPTMTNLDFANHVTTLKGLLTQNEMALVFQKISVFNNANIDCPFPSEFRCDISKYYVPFREVIQLFDASVLYDLSRNQHCNLETMFRNVKDSADDEALNVTPLCIVLQCCADLANSEWIPTYAKPENQDIRNQIHSEFKTGKALAKSKQVKDLMAQFMGIRTKLDELCPWKESKA